MTETTDQKALQAPEKKPATTHIMVDGREMPASAQPPQSELQEAFAIGGTKNKPRIVIDMPRAREVARDMIRQARAKAFAENDGNYMRAAQTGDIDAQQKHIDIGSKLRAAPADPRIDEAKTPDALLAAVEAIIAEF